MPRQPRLVLGHRKRWDRAGKCRFRNQSSYVRPPKAVIPHDADSGAGTPELIDHSPGSQDGVVCDVVLSHREQAVDWQGQLA